METLELAIAVRPHAVEAMADLLRQYAPAGVSIEPPFESIDEDGGVALHENAAVRLRIWLPPGASTTDAAIEELRTSLGPIANDIVEPLSVNTVQEEDWADAWKEHFQVTRIGERIVLKPSWRDYDPNAGDIVVELDPGRAFGTGQHETTRMCLVELEQQIDAGMTVLDVGSGSGILSVTAALLGAGHVDAIDVDAAAVRATRENAEANGVADSVHIAKGSLGEAWPFPEPPRGRYDLVLANISARVVRELADALLAALNETGTALVCGIIAEQEESCVEALVQAGARSLEQRAEGDWRLLIVRR